MRRGRCKWASVCGHGAPDLLLAWVGVVGILRGETMTGQIIGEGVSPAPVQGTTMRQRQRGKGGAECARVCGRGERVRCVREWCLVLA